MAEERPRNEDEIKKEENKKVPPSADDPNRERSDKHQKRSKQ
jgi:hypothetical protein